MAFRAIPATAGWAAATAMGGLAFGAMVCLNAPLALVSLGLWFGVPQSVVLRRLIRWPWLWALVTALAMLLAWIAGILIVLIISGLSQSVGQASPPPTVLTSAVAGFAYVVAMLVAGGIVGLAQGGLLPEAARWRRPWLCWTAVGAVAFWVILVGGLVAFGGGWTATNALVGGTREATTTPVLIAGSALGALGYGLVTGPTLSRITPER